ncbi:sialoadhesin-like isoform X1 [Pelobates cultripes]|uniref:Sialoadhesin-like isoform X1 n=1 Tax=Pelobates cultripes TaxID=61616 RepID=A0AAD1WMU3_PELCU|nr:sialoadhesin-like isoform X1 [Pelobates cultripes]
MNFNKTFLLIILQGLYLVSFGQDKWDLLFHMKALTGSCVELPSSFQNPWPCQDVVWYQHENGNYIEISKSNISPEIRSRILVVKTEDKNCSLRINDVRNSDEAWYYPQLRSPIKPYLQVIKLDIINTLNQPVIIWNGDMIEGQPVTFTCHVEHTCWSSPPALWWNMPSQHGNKVKQSGKGYQKNFIDGKWMSLTDLEYIPLSDDHNMDIYCSATFFEGKTSYAMVKLNIKFSPKNTNVKILGNTLLKQGNNVTLQCVTQSNPAASSYTWYKVEDNSTEMLEETTEKLIVKIMNWKSNRYFCSAINTLGTEYSNPLELSVQSHGSPTYLVTSVVLGIISFILFVSTIYICWRCGKCPKRKYWAAQPVNTIYTDLEKKNISPDYSNLKPENRHIPAEAMKIDDVREYENISQKI